MMELGVWKAVLGYTLASSCGLLWCIEGVVTNALQSDIHANFARSGKSRGSAWDDPEFVEAVLRLVLSRLVDSQLGIFAMLNFAVSIYAVGALTTKTIFLGELTRLESSHMRERLLKFLAFKVVMVAAVWSAALEDSPFWLPMISYLAYIKVFVGLARDRLNGLLASPSATSVAHMRALGLLAWIVTDNATWVLLHFAAFPGSDMTYRLLWLFDPVVITVEALLTASTYGIQMWDRWRTKRAQAGAAGAAPPWEGKGGLLYHIDLGLDLVIRVLSVAHVFHVWWLHGLTYKPMDAVLFLDIRSLAFSITAKVRTYAHYCSATYNLQHNFPSMDPAQLRANHEDCAICKEPMKAAKLLPCGHMYHLGCLRDWLQQSGTDNFTCPICRTPLFVKKQPLPGSRQNRWLSGEWLANVSALWQPAPYAYLDDASGNGPTAAAPLQPPTADFHVTTAPLPRDEPFREEQQQHHSLASTSDAQLQHSGLRHRHRLGNLQPWPSEAEHRNHDLVHQSDACGSHGMSTSQRQQSRSSGQRWPWFRGLHLRPRRRSQQSPCRASAPCLDQHDMLNRVKEVLPHLSNDDILAELEVAQDVDQAVENLLSR